jgi:hypothetical protein
MPGRGAVLLFLLTLAIGLPVVVSTGDLRLPFDQSGYEPVQPIAFSHRLHAGEMGIDCLFCHTGAERSRHAGFPSVSTCFSCHEFVRGRWDSVRAGDTTPSAEIEKVIRAYALGETEALAWVKVHNLADFVYFDHARHTQGGVACARCHGEVETMERVRQTVDMNMGWCVDCHRQENVRLNTGVTIDEYIEERAGIDCAKCHY